MVVSLFFTACCCCHSWFRVFTAAVDVLHGGEPSGPGSGAVLLSRVCLHGPRHFCAAWSTNVQLFNIHFFFFLPEGRNVFMFVHLSPLVLGFGRYKLAKRETFYRPVHRIISYLLAFTHGYPYHFYGELLRCTVGKCRGCVRFDRRGEINRSVKKKRATDIRSAIIHYIRSCGYIRSLTIRDFPCTRISAPLRSVTHSKNLLRFVISKGGYPLRSPSLLFQNAPRSGVICYSSKSDVIVYFHCCCMSMSQQNARYVPSFRTRDQDIPSLAIDVRRYAAVPLLPLFATSY